MYTHKKSTVQTNQLQVDSKCKCILCETNFEVTNASQSEIILKVLKKKNRSNDHTHNHTSCVQSRNERIC